VELELGERGEVVEVDGVRVDGVDVVATEEREGEDMLRLHYKAFAQ
jgi:hypothetical protein